MKLQQVAELLGLVRELFRRVASRVWLRYKLRAIHRQYIAQGFTATKCDGVTTYRKDCQSVSITIS